MDRAYVLKSDWFFSPRIRTRYAIGESGIRLANQQSTGIPAPIQTDLQYPSTDVVTNHVACDIKEVRKLLKRLNALMP